MSIWNRFKNSLQRAFSAGQGAMVDRSIQGGTFQAADQKAQILRLATAVLDGRLVLFDGSRQLLMYMGGFPDAFPHFAVLFEEWETVPVFGAVQGAAEQFYPLPESPDRHLWNAEVVANRDRDRQTFEATVRPQVDDACRKIVRWLSE